MILDAKRWKMLFQRPAAFRKSPKEKLRRVDGGEIRNSVSRWLAERRGYGALSSPAHDVGLDGPRAGGASHCPKERQRGAS